jgi:hypothetical protein
MAAGLTGGPGAAASEEMAGVGDLGAGILAGLPEAARSAVEPFLGAIVAGVHEAFSQATGSIFLLGVGAVMLAFLVLLPLAERRLPRERLAELRDRQAAAERAGGAGTDGAASSGGAPRAAGPVGPAGRAT